MGNPVSIDHSDVQNMNIALFNAKQVLGDKGTSKGPQDSNIDNKGSAAITNDELKEMLRAYEKAKLKMEAALLQNSTDLKNSPLAKVLKDDPLWISMTQNSSNGPAPTQVILDPNKVQNFFFLVFKFLKENKDSDSKMQVAEAVNMVAKEAQLDSVTEESVNALNDTKAQIQAADDAKNSPLAKFLQIGLPIILAVITLVITVATAGTATAGVVAADTAAETTLAVTAESAASTLSTGAGSMVDSVATGAMEMTSTTLTEAAEETTEEVTTNIAKDVAKDAVKEVGKRSALRTGCAVAAFGAGAGATVFAAQYEMGKVQSDYTLAVSNATTILQGETTINSAASDSIQNDMKVDMNYQQTVQSNVEAASSMQQQMVQAETKVLTIGSF